MGRMKELYMEIREEYGDELPEDFSLGQYQLKKELEYEEIREIEERLKQSQSTSTDDAKGLSGD
jgi:predicted nuclease with TOPRIM domain